LLIDHNRKAAARRGLEGGRGGVRTGRSGGKKQEEGEEQEGNSHPSHYDGRHQPAVPPGDSAGLEASASLSLS